MTSTGDRTSPIIRGSMIMDQFLNNPPPPPPPNVPELKEASDDPIPIRKMIEMHQDKAQCSSCHSKIDPIGFGLESFDAIGRWRSIEKLSDSIDSLNPFEEKRDIFATSVLSESINLQFDTEGRISIPESLLKHAKIKNIMFFVGQGTTFQIWEPKIFEKFKIKVRKKASLNRASLKWENQFKKEER